MKYTQTEYIDVLLTRQAAYAAEHPPVPGREWARPLLDWFIEDDDEVEGITYDVVEPTPAATPQRRDRRPEYRARLDRNRARLQLIEQRLAALVGDGGDPAQVNISPYSRSRAAAAAGRRRYATLDRNLDRTSRLLDTAAHLRHKIALDEQRLTRAEGAHRG